MNEHDEDRPLTIRDLPKDWQGQIRNVSLMTGIKQNINIDELTAPRWVWENLYFAAMRKMG